MSTPIEIVRLSEADFPAAAGVGARAFLDDPLFIYVLPDVGARREKLPIFMEWATRYGHLFGEAYTTAGRVDGAAFWIPPDGGAVTPECLEATGFGRVVEAFGVEAMARRGAVLAHLDDLHHRMMPAPHWHLIGIGVDPPRQGQGIGGQLMQPVFARADAGQLPCYLETQKERNVPFYRRHGFDVVGETDPPRGGPHFWLMARPPREQRR